MLAALLGPSVAACGAASGDASPCPSGQLVTRAPGTLTVATGPVTRAPWVVPDKAGRPGDPRAGKGYDAAVGAELARRLGYDGDRVRWVRTPFGTAVGDGDKSFDLDINQVTITPERRTAIDLSVPYYRARWALVGLASGPRPLDLVALRGLRLVAVGPQGKEVLDRVVRPTTPVLEVRDLEGLRRAVGDGTAHAGLMAYPDALRVVDDEQQLVTGRLVGVLDELVADGEEFGVVLPKGSPLTPCVDKALTDMGRDGTLDRLEQRWLVAQPGALRFE